MVVRYVDERLSVRLVNVPLSDALGAVARSTGADITGEPAHPAMVTAQFDDVPLTEGLARVLGDDSFSLVYGTDGRLRTIRLLGRGETNATAASASARATPPPASAGGLASLFHEHPPVAISGALATSLGNATAPLDRIAQVALQTEDPAVRREAMRTINHAIESEPALRASVLDVLDRMDDGVLLAMVQRAGGAQARDLLLQVAAQSTSKPLRERAATLLERLPPPASRPGGS